MATTRQAAILLFQRRMNAERQIGNVSHAQEEVDRYDRELLALRYEVRYYDTNYSERQTDPHCQSAAAIEPVPGDRVAILCPLE